jgi:hypothetical protein
MQKLRLFKFSEKGSKSLGKKVEMAGSVSVTYNGFLTIWARLSVKIRFPRFSFLCYHCYKPKRLVKIDALLIEE